MPVRPNSIHRSPTRLDKILRDANEPLSLRCTVATALGRLNYQAPAKLDTVGTAKELGYLALVACDSELNRIKTLRTTELEREARLSGQSQGGGSSPYGDPMGAGGGAYDMPMGGGSGPPGVIPGSGGYGSIGAGAPTVQDPKGYRFEFVRRRIRQQLYCVQMGLTGGEDFTPGKAPRDHHDEPTRSQVTVAGHVHLREARRREEVRLRRVRQGSRPGEHLREQGCRSGLAGKRTPQDDEGAGGHY